MLKFSNSDKVCVAVAIAGFLAFSHLYLKHFNTKKVIVVQEKI